MTSQVSKDRPATMEDLVDMVAPLVHYWANKMAPTMLFGSNRLLEDIVQDAWVGVVEAFHNYKQSYKCSFLSYVTSMIRWYILNGARKADPGLGRLYVQIFRSGEEGKDAALDRYHKARSQVSLDCPIGLGGDFSTHLDLVPADQPDPLEAVSDNIGFDLLLSKVHQTRIRWVLEQHYRFERDLSDIGRELCVSRERVRQIKEKGLAMIRRKMGGK